MTPSFLIIIFIVSCGMVVLGSYMFYRTWKKSRLVRCTFCDDIMDKDDFNLHAEQHIKSSQTKEKIIAFKIWLLKEIEKGEPLDEERLVKEGAIVCGLSTNTVRPLLRSILKFREDNPGKEI